MIRQGWKILAFIVLAPTIFFLLFLMMTSGPKIESIVAKDFPGIYIAEYGGNEHERLDLLPGGTYLLDYFDAQGRQAYHQEGKWKCSFDRDGRSYVLFNGLPPPHPRTAWPEPRSKTLFPDYGISGSTPIYKFHDEIVVSIDSDVVFGYGRKVIGKAK